MIVVTGCGRSGTSVVLQTLDLLGVPMSAPKFIPEHDNIRQFNPNGFYEQNDYEGLKEDTGKAIKLWGHQLYLTPKEFISKLICVQRDKEAAIASYDKVRQYLPLSPYTSEYIYEMNKFYIDKCIDEKTLLLGLDFIQSSPKHFIQVLVDYLGINPTQEQINNALNNIKCQ